MKTSYKILFALLITFAQVIAPSLMGRAGGGAALYAQDDNAAFYIYQNDGHFDGFFYDQVQKISYSKLDTLGLEHDDYVSQEIITADSVYRFMLTAIDSVSFVQPEIKFNPRLVVMEDVGMLSYCLGRSGQMLMFTNLPANLIPEVGDVLVTYEFSNPSFPEGFGGKVNRVQTSGSTTNVYTDELTDFSDIFQQFVTVEDYGYDADTQQFYPRRVAGMKNVRRPGSSFEGTLFKFTLSPHLSWVNDNFSVSADMNVGMECRAKAVWNFSFFGEKYFKVDLKEKIETGMSLTLDLQLKTPWKEETKFGQVAPVYIPTVAPILRILLTPEGFIRSQMHATAQVSKRKQAAYAGQTIEFKNWSFGGSRMFFGDEAKFEEDKDQDPGPLFQLSGNISGFVQAGVKWPLIIRTNEFFKKVLDAEVGMTIYAGPKISGEINFNANDWANSLLSGSPTKIYNSLKDTKATINPFVIDYGMKSLVNYLSYKGDTLTILDGSVDWTSWDWYLFPTFDKPQVLPVRSMGGGCRYDPDAQFMADGQRETCCVNIKPRRDPLISTPIGAAFYKNGELVSSSEDVPGQGYSNPLYTSEKYYDTDKTRWDGHNPLAAGPVMYPVDGLANIYGLYLTPGHYKVYPTINILGQTIACEPGLDFDLPGMYFDMDSQYEHIDASGDEGTTVEVVVKTNGNLIYDFAPSNVSVQQKLGDVGYHDADGDFRLYSARDRRMMNLPDTLLLTLSRNPEMLPKETMYVPRVYGYDANGNPDTLTHTVMIKQTAYNVYGLAYAYFSQTLKCNSGNAKGSTINVSESIGTLTLESASRSGDIVTGSGSMTDDDGSTCSVTFSCDVASGKVLTGTVSKQWSYDSYGQTVNCNLKFDIDNFESEDGPQPMDCVYRGRATNVTYSESGNDSSGTWTNTYVMDSNNSKTSRITLIPRNPNQNQ